MRTASGLVLTAIGAILAFAVTSQPSFLNLHVTGWVLMLVGIIGIVLPRRGYGWLRRRVVIRQPGSPPVSGQAATRKGFPGRPGSLLTPVPPESRPPTLGVSETMPGAERYPAEETVEEFLEE